MMLFTPVHSKMQRRRVKMRMMAPRDHYSGQGGRYRIHVYEIVDPIAFPQDMMRNEEAPVNLDFDSEFLRPFGDMFNVMLGQGENTTNK
mmetsp:Transcript_3778/g.7140  ORF Transcript_3778/g.7140 Transcript_3778/m.7140 type:complete len:89 (-) Transcript_3778:263-529(-)